MVIWSKVLIHMTFSKLKNFPSEGTYNMSKDIFLTTWHWKLWRDSLFKVLKVVLVAHNEGRGSRFCIENSYVSNLINACIKKIQCHFFRRKCESCLEHFEVQSSNSSQTGTINFADTYPIRNNVLVHKCNGIDKYMDLFIYYKNVN